MKSRLQDQRAQNQQQLAHQAAQWVVVLQRGAGAEERAAFADWLRQSPYHVQAFLFQAALDREMTRFDAQREHDIEAILGEISSNVVPLKSAAAPEAGAASEPASTPCSVSRRYASGIAGLALLATSLTLGYALLSGHLDGWTRFQTAVGEQRSVQLEDGSVINLNTQSELEVRLSEASRDVRLLAGEALFKVAHDPIRPFKVTVDGATIQAIGTQFNVYRQGDLTTVAVVEGRVQVTDRHSRIALTKLAAGQEVHVDNDGRVSEIAPVDVVRVTAWRQRRLAFQSETLADIAAQFNRYNREPRLLVEHSVGGRRFSGNFDADDVESFVTFLATYKDLTAEKKGVTIIIRKRDQERHAKL